MKKGWKIFWIICGCAAGIGLVLCIAGAAMGASLFSVRKAYATSIGDDNGIFSNRGFWHRDDGYDSGHSDGYNEYDGYDAADAGYISGNEEDVSDFQGVREIDVEAAYLQVIVKEGEGDDVLIDASKVDSRLRDRLVYEQEDGELKIESIDRTFWRQFSRSNTGKLVIQLPKDRAMEDVSLEIGAGQLTIEQIHTGCLDINVGAGQAIVKQFEAKDLNVECGAGQAELRGSVSRKADVDCGVGEVVMNLTGSQDDYDYELDCGIGELAVGTDSYAGLGSKRHIDNGAGKRMEINCGIGRVDISFSEKQ